MINDQVKQSLYNLTLFEAIAEEANQDPFQYERYTFLLQNFLKNIEEAYTSSSTPQPTSTDLPRGSLSENFKKEFNGCLLKQALCNKTAKTFELIHGKPNVFSNRTKALSSLTRERFISLKQNVLNASEEDLTLQVEALKASFQDFSTSWLNDYKTAENEVLNPLLSAITISHKNPASKKIVFNTMISAALSLGVIEQAPQLRILQVLLASPNQQTPLSIKILQEAFSNAYKNVLSELEKLDVDTVSLDDLHSNELTDALFKLFTFYEHAKAHYKNPLWQRYFSHTKTLPSSENIMKTLTLQVCLSDVQNNTPQRSQHVSYMKYFSMAKSEYEALSEDDQDKLQVYIQDPKEKPKGKIKRVIRCLNLCLTFEKMLDNRKEVFSLLDQTESLLKAADRKESKS